MRKLSFFKTFVAFALISVISCSSSDVGANPHISIQSITVTKTNYKTQDGKPYIIPSNLKYHISICYKQKPPVYIEFQVFSASGGEIKRLHHDRKKLNKYGCRVLYKYVGVLKLSDFGNSKKVFVKIRMGEDLNFTLFEKKLEILVKEEIINVN